MRVPELTYNWLEHGAEDDPDLGDYGAIRSERYWADDFVAETRFQNVDKVVHVQAALGTEDPVAETAWLQRFTDRLGVPHGIVAYADLTSPDLDRTLERHLQYPGMRGIRDFRYDDYLSDERWERGFARLGELGLVLCDDPLLDQVPKLAAMASRHPEVTVCIDHACFPRRRDDEYFREWREAIRTLAAVPLR